MLKQLVTLVRGLMERLFTAPSSLTVEQPSPSAKRSRAKSTQTLKGAQQPVRQSPKRKSLTAKPTTPVKLRKQTQKPAQQTLGQDGLQPATPASQTRQPASKQQTPKRKPAASTKVAKKVTKGLTRAATPTARKSKVRGS